MIKIITSLNNHHAILSARMSNVAGGSTGLGELRSAAALPGNSAAQAVVLVAWTGSISPHVRVELGPSFLCGPLRSPRPLRYAVGEQRSVWVALRSGIHGED
jgi:hypothetical protein